MYVGIADPRWRGKLSRHSRRMRNRQFYVSGKRPIPQTWFVQKTCWSNTHDFKNGLSYGQTITTLRDRSIICNTENLILYHFWQHVCIAGCPQASEILLVNEILHIITTWHCHINGLFPLKQMESTGKMSTIKSRYCAALMLFCYWPKKLIRRLLSRQWF